MILQNPIGLLGLLIIPLFIILRFLRARPRTVIVPSLLIWDMVSAEPESERKHRRFSFIINLLLQIIALTLLSLALTNPAFVSQQSVLPETIIVLDNSIGMETQNPDGTTRWGLAINHIKQWTKQQPSNLPITLLPTVSGPPGRASVRTGNTHLITSELPAYLDTLSPKEILVDWNDWLVKMSPVLSSFNSTTPLYVYSDRPLTDEIIQRMKISPIQILFGSPSKNIGIIHLAASTLQNEISVLVVVKNFSGESKSFSLSIYSDKVLKSERPVTLAPQSEQTIIFEQVDIVKPEIIEARLNINDDLTCDNQAYLTLLPASKVKICLIGKQSNVLTRVLKANPSVEWTYFSELTKGKQDYDIYIYNKVIPMTQTNYGKIIVINPYSDFYPFHLKERKSNQQITYHNTNSPILSEVDTSGFHIWQSRGIEITESEKAFFQPLLSSGNDIILSEWNQGQNHIIISGFDMEWLNPKDSDTDWALTPYFPIFWMNLINYLSEKPDRPSGGNESFHNDYGYYKTGSQIKYLNSIPEKSGIYEATVKDKKILIAINLCDSIASDNNGLAKIPNAQPTPNNLQLITRDVLYPFNFWLVLVGLILLLLSWWLERNQNQ